MSIAAASTLIVAGDPEVVADGDAPIGENVMADKFGGAQLPSSLCTRRMCVPDCDRLRDRAERHRLPGNRASAVHPIYDERRFARAFDQDRIRVTSALPARMMEEGIE